MKHLNIILIAALALFVIAARTPANGPLNLYVNASTGNDCLTTGSPCVANGCAMQSAPCLTINHAADLVWRSYDLVCYQATINVAHGTYAESVTLYGPPPVGQCSGPSGLLFLGDPSSPGSVIIAPPGGPAFGINSGAMAEVNGFKCDMLLNNPAGQDCIQVQNGGNAIVDSFVFGDNLNPFGDITVTGSGSNLTARAWNTPCGGPGQATCLGYEIAKTAVTIQASWPGPGGSTSVVYVSSCAGVMANMTVHGAGIPDQTAAINCDAVHGYLALNNNVTGSASGQNIYLCKCGQHHAYVSVNAEMSYATNAGQSPFTIEMSGGPTYYLGTFVVSQSGTANLGVNWTGGAAGNKYVVFLNGTLHAGVQSLSSLPGDTVVAPWLGGQAD